MSNDQPITPADDSALIKIICDYLRGEEIGAIKSQLREQCDKFKSACKVRYKDLTPRKVDLDYASSVASILDELSEKNTEHYISTPNLYAALDELSIKHPHLTRLIELIDETKPVHNWPLYIRVAAGATVAAGLFFYLKENIERLKAWYLRGLPVILRWFNNTIELLRETPLIGILFRAVPLANAWYQAITDNSITKSRKKRELFFKTMEHGLGIAGYVLCFLAAGTMTLPAMAMFVTASLIDVIETYYTFRSDEHYSKKNFHKDSNNYYTDAAMARADNAHDRNKHVFAVNFIANILLLASVIIWCAFPPSLIIALPCLAFGWIVILGKGAWLAKTRDNNAEALQIKIREIVARYPDPASGPSSSVVIGQLLGNPPGTLSLDNLNRPSPAVPALAQNILPEDRSEQSDIRLSFGYN